MKYGNFVGKGWLPFKKKEIREIISHLQIQLNNQFGEGFFGEPAYQYSPATRKGGVISLCVYFPLENPFNGRNIFNATVSGLDKVWFFITKDKKGYLEIHDQDDYWNIEKYTRDYVNCPDFSYGCSMHVSGQERGYRKKHWESIQNWSPYVYGTEVSDITYEVSQLRKLQSTMTASNKQSKTHGNERITKHAA